MADTIPDLFCHWPILGATLIIRLSQNDSSVDTFAFEVGCVKRVSKLINETEDFLDPP